MSLRSRTRLPPGPAVPPLLQSLRYIWRPVGFVEDCARRYGDCFTVQLLGDPPTVTFTRPEAIKDILTGPEAVLSGGVGNTEFLGPILGWHSIILLDGAAHRRERRLMLPAFHGERVHAYGEVMRDVTSRVVATWPLGRAFPLQRQMHAITLEVIMRTVFGLEEGPELVSLREQLVRMLALANSPAAALIAMPALRLDIGRVSPWSRFLRHRERFRSILRGTIARRRAAGSTGRGDILSLLIAARDEQGAPMTDDELFDEMFTLLLAGYETSATALTWLFYELLTRPKVLAAVRDELREVTGGGSLEVHHLPKLEFLDATIKETARLRPVIMDTIRRLKAPGRIGGCDLPEGVNVAASIYLAHRWPEVWTDPQRFDPGRFCAMRPSPYAFFPYGGGERRCLGAAFASYEVKVVCAEVLLRVALRLAPSYRMRPVLRTVAVAPSRGMPVEVEYRMS